MNIFRLVLLILVLNFCFLTWIGYSKVEASDYRGEVCWELAEDGITPFGIFRLGVSHMGGGHHLLNGRFIEYGGGPSIVHGSAEVEGQNILMTLVYSGKSNDPANTAPLDTGIIHVTLDKSTLNGTSEGLSHAYDNQTQMVIEEYDNDTLTHIKCP